MKKIICSLFACLVYLLGTAQLSSADIRQASGHGPYPITISVQGIAANGSNMFADFIRTYNQEHGAHNPRSLLGWEANLSIVTAINDFLGVKNWEMHGYTLGVGYRYLFRNLRNGDNERIHLQEESIGLRMGKRFNIIYPLTFEILGGPTFYNFYTVSKHSDESIGTDPTSIETRIRYGGGLFERDQVDQELCSGFDLKCRLKFFDPAGTEGGIGGFIEWGTMITFGTRDLGVVYQEFLPPAKVDTKGWDYGYISAGLIFPIGLRLVSRK